MKRFWAVIAVVLGVAGMSRSGRAEVRAYLATAGPGDSAEELYGHDAIVLRNEERGVEGTYNWGVYDFDQPNFIGRFILGRMLYSMSGDGAGVAHMTRTYSARHRALRLVRLNLSPRQIDRLGELCAANDTDGHRDYRYDYYRDNCATRVRDKLDEATGGQLAAQLKARMTERTYRYYTDGYARRVPWLYVGLHYVMGHSMDRPLNAWDEGFLPEVLERNLGDVRVRWEDGTVHSLLGASRDLVPNTRGAFEPPPRVWPYFLAVGVAWGGLLAGLVGTRAGRRMFSPLLMLGWAGLCSVAGGLSTFGWVFTDHVDSRNNENWLQLSPLSIPLVLLGAGWMVMGPKVLARKWMGRLPVFAWVALGLSVLGVVLKVLPVMSQPNWDIIALALPVHTGVVLALRRMRGVVLNSSPAPLTSVNS